MNTEATSKISLAKRLMYSVASAAMGFVCVALMLIVTADEMDAELPINKLWPILSIASASMFIFGWICTKTIHALLIRHSLSQFTSNEYEESYFD